MPTIDVLTWNLNGLDESLRDERTEVAASLMVLGTTVAGLTLGVQPWVPPDVLLLQEVVARTYHAHLKPHLSAAGYVLIPDAPSAHRNYFEVVAVRAPWTVHAIHAEPLDRSLFGRWLTRVDLAAGDLTARIVTAHFDSGKDASDIRQKQLGHVAYELGDHGIFGGDANLRVREWEKRSSRLTMRDAFEVLGEPEDCRVTWYGGEDDAYKSRFDRVFVGAGVEPLSMCVVGGERLSGLGRPADHVGAATPQASAPRPSDHLGVRVRSRLKASSR